MQQLNTSTPRDTPRKASANVNASKTVRIAEQPSNLSQTCFHSPSFVSASILANEKRDPLQQAEHFDFIGNGRSTYDAHAIYQGQPLPPVIEDVTKTMNPAQILEEKKKEKFGLIWQDIFENHCLEHPALNP